MSEVSICNQALSWLREAPIISLDDPSAKAGVCKLNYYPVRDAVLEAHNWTFAIGRYNLAPLSEAPEFRYSKAYTIPVEVLRVISVNEQDMNDPTRDWQVEGDSIVSNESSCKVKAVVRVEDPDKFSALFTQAFAARLAADMAISITGSRALQEQNYRLYLQKMREAVSVDNLQGKSQRIRSRWMSQARNSGGPRTTQGPVV